MLVDRVRGVLAIVVIPLGIIIMQSHSIPFWHELVQWHTDYWWVNTIPGVLWSVTLELISLWQWLQPKQWKQKRFGILVTILLIGGPLYQTVTPVYIAWTAKATTPQEVAKAEADVAFVQEQLASGRKGAVIWQNLENAQAKLAEVQQREKLTSSQPILFYARAVALALSMLVFTYSTVLALDALSRSSARQAPTNQQRPPSAPLARRLMMAYLNNGASIVQLAIKSGLTVQEVEAIINGKELTQAEEDSLIQHIQRPDNG